MAEFETVLVCVYKISISIHSISDLLIIKIDIILIYLKE